MHIDHPGTFSEFPWPPLDVRFPAGANWVRFADPEAADADLLPAPVLPRPARTPDLVRQWRQWQEALRSGQHPEAHPDTLIPLAPEDSLTIRVPPDFEQLTPWPEVRGRCRDTWPAFQRWRAACHHRLDQISGGRLGRSVVTIVASMTPGQAAKIDLIALAEPRVLREEPGDATLTLGFLASGRYLPWLREFTAAAPRRETPPGWYIPPPPPPVPGESHSPSGGGHRVTVSSGTMGHWFAFACPDLASTDFLEPPAGRPEPDATARAQWRAWWEQVRAQTAQRPDARRPLIDDLLVEFHRAAKCGSDTAATLPELPAYCRAAWPAFDGWFPNARQRADEVGRGAARTVADLHAAHPRWGKTSSRSDTIDVVPVRAARVLYQEPGYAIVTAGLVESDGFTNWVLDFTADPE